MLFSGYDLPLSYASIFPPLLAVVFLFNNFFYKAATFYHLTVIIQDNFKLRTQSRWHWTLASGWGHAYLRISLPIRGNYFSNTSDISTWTLGHSQVDEIAVKSRTANGSLYFYSHHLYERSKFKSQVSLLQNLLGYDLILAPDHKMKIQAIQSTRLWWKSKQMHRKF